MWFLSTETLLKRDMYVGQRPIFQGPVILPIS